MIDTPTQPSDHVAPPDADIITLDDSILSLDELDAELSHLKKKKRKTKKSQKVKSSSEVTTDSPSPVLPFSHPGVPNPTSKGPSPELLKSIIPNFGLTDSACSNRSPQTNLVENLISTPKTRPSPFKSKPLSPFQIPLETHNSPSNFDVKPMSPFRIPSSSSSPKSLKFSSDDEDKKTRCNLGPDTSSSDSPSPIAFSVKRQGAVYVEPKAVRRVCTTSVASSPKKMSKQRKTLSTKSVDSKSFSSKVDRKCVTPIQTCQILGRRRRPIIVDACNVAYQHGKNNRFSAKGLLLIRDYFVKNQGYTDDEIFIVNKPIGKKTLEDLAILDQLYQSGVLINTVRRLFKKYFLKVLCQTSTMENLFKLKFGFKVLPNPSILSIKFR